MPRALKVYRTPIGFHDAYVAASTQKAALTAWGSDKDLFARGLVEIVEDPKLTAEPLAKPGTVIKRLRGTMKQQLAALPTDAAPKQASKSAAKASETKRLPKPTRSRLEAAEHKLATVAKRNRAEQEKLRDRERKIAERRHALAIEQRSEEARLEEAVDIERATYEDALRAWQS